MKAYNLGKFPNLLTPVALGVALLVCTGSFGTVQASRISEWSQPVNLGPEVNSAFEDIAPHLSSDGLALYFGSTRPGTLGGEDLWVSRRDDRDAPWGPATNIGPAINTTSNERSPSLSFNGRLLFFATDRAGGAGGFDIWLSWRADPTDDQGWQAPVNMGTAINTTATDAGPAFLEGGDARRLHKGRFPAAIPQLFMSSNRAGGPGGLDLYVGSVPGGWSGPATLIAELSSPQADLTPTIRRDGREIIFATNRPGVLGGFDLWQSYRKSGNDLWSEPTSLGPLVNSESLDLFPSLSSDAATLIFQSNRAGGFGGSDLYISTRW